MHLKNIFNSGVLIVPLLFLHALPHKFLVFVPKINNIKGCANPPISERPETLQLYRLAPTLHCLITISDTSHKMKNAKTNQQHATEKYHWKNRKALYPTINTLVDCDPPTGFDADHLRPKTASRRGAER
ncbi:hypothetical protein ONS95_007195 [Cadophora gregata]|uniref:uncharacterized protein n=1 Tax=Cadophora gregata TaxID=51156 RepID=UPI0026DA8C60|nr:uncharacterized protein ONS95_007195 [Cadophora gregata]KAK0100745.1 hypothetical protein ONS95_007195 [Cadophora gregata]KAK0117259.1 hypothetical protein ONS96_013092 [Cadophora gregata f. sp. sojae]